MNEDLPSGMPQMEFSSDNHVNWPLLSFRDLKAAYDKSAQPGDPEFALAVRYGDIMNFVEGDRIWPPVQSPLRGKLTHAFCTVLSRLPDDTFSRLEDVISVVVEISAMDMLAVNVPAPHCVPVDHRIDTIVFFRACSKLSAKALVGLVAHETAHSFVSGRDFQKDEALTNQQVIDWGFGEELHTLRKEKEEKWGGDPFPAAPPVI